MEIEIYIAIGIPVCLVVILTCMYVINKHKS